jgi:DNA-binding CsgD family transcriptional regulator
MDTSLPLSRISDLLLDCGSFRDSKVFAKRVLDLINDLIPYDQGRLYFLDDNGVVYDDYVLGVDRQVVNEYHEYYSQVDNGAYSVSRRARSFHFHYPRTEECVYCWDDYGKDHKFFQEYVRPYKIMHSFGLGLRDTQNVLKCMFSLDRVCDIKYSMREIAIMELIRAHLDNLFQNLYVAAPSHAVGSRIVEDSLLTPREIEIAGWLVKGVLPMHIGKKLCISDTTVKKHLSNMHAKLNVSTRQELVVKLFNLG